MRPRNRINKIIRETKHRWQLSLLLIISFSFGLIVYSINEGLESPIISALIAVTPPSIYYLHQEFLTKPAVSFSDKNDPWDIAPLYAPQEILSNLDGNSISVGGTSPTPIEHEEGEIELQVNEARQAIYSIGSHQVARPGIFLRIKATNIGRETAENARVEVELFNDKQTYNYFARWDNPANSETYSLYPGQSHDVFVAKIFVSDDFFPTSDLVQPAQGEEFTEEDKSQFFGIPNLSITGNPDGRIRPFSSMEPSDLSFRIFVPREQRPEKTDVSIAGGWEGNEIIPSPYDSSEYHIRARIISNNYRSSWQEISSFHLPAQAIEIARYDRHWQNQWNKGHMELLKNQFQETIEEYSVS